MRGPPAPAIALLVLLAPAALATGEAVIVYELSLGSGPQAGATGFGEYQGAYAFQVSPYRGMLIRLLATVS